ncbi:MAG: patatin-like phospholipase family protein [Gammaproteobacteria bacterium]
MTLALALEGCAGRAAFQVGAVEWFGEQGLRVTAAAGASSGSIVAALTAFLPARELREAWLAGAGERVFRPEMLLRGRWPLVMSDIVGNALETVLGGARLAESPIPLAIPVTHAGRRGRTRRVLTRKDDVPVVDAVLASCFVPGPYARRIVIGGRLALDGAWQVRTPVEEAMALGGGQCLAIVTNSEKALYRGYPVKRAAAVPAGCRVLGPDQPLALGSFDTDRGRILAAMAAGRSAAMRLAASGAVPGDEDGEVQAGGS